MSFCASGQQSQNGQYLKEKDGFVAQKCDEGMM